MGKVRFVALNPDRSGGLRKYTVDTSNVRKVRAAARGVTFGGRVGTLPSTKIEMVDGTVYKIPQSYGEIAEYFENADVREIPCTVPTEALMTLVPESAVRDTLLDAALDQ